MLIVHLSNTPVAGAPLAITSAINRYTEHTSVAVHREHHRWFPTLRIDREIDEVKRFLSKADIIHCHGNFSIHHPGRHRKVGEFARKNRKKGSRLVWQAHASPQECPDPEWFLAKNNPYELTIVAQGWERYWPDAAKDFFYVRNPIDAVEDPHLRPIPWVQRDPVICFNPSNRFCNDVRYGRLYRPEKTNPKGWEYVRRELQGFPLRTIEDLPYHENVCAKGHAFLGIDDVVTPMFHRSGLEFLARGVACIQYMDGASLNTLYEVSRCDKPPFLVIDRPEALRSTVEEIWPYSDNLRTMGEEARVWMDLFWQTSQIATEYVHLYEGFL